MAITINPSHAHRIIVFRIQAPFIKARGATTLESIYPSLAWRRLGLYLARVEASRVLSPGLPTPCSALFRA
jgi:hypothetical protein